MIVNWTEPVVFMALGFLCQAFMLGCVITGTFVDWWAFPSRIKILWVTAAVNAINSWLFLMVAATGGPQSAEYTPVLGLAAISLAHAMICVRFADTVKLRAAAWRVEPQLVELDHAHELFARAFAQVLTLRHDVATVNEGTRRP